jgi:hypothetical protein
MLQLTEQARSIGEPCPSALVLVSTILGIWKKERTKKRKETMWKISLKKSIEEEEGS